MSALLKNRLITLFLIVLITPGCRKDPPVVTNLPEIEPCVEENCKTFPEDYGLGFNYIVEGIQYYKPSFNPNNSDEFVFIRLNAGVSSPELVRYNFSTGEQTVLHSSVLGRPKWGRQGWITFPGSDNIFVIKDDGSNLVQITWGVDDSYPMFNYTGDKIYYYRNKNYSNSALEGNPDLYKEYKEMLVDLNGNEVDSILIPSISNPNSPYFSYQHWGIADIDVNGKVYATLGDGANSYGVYEVDLLNKTVEAIRTWSTGTSGDFLATDIVYCDGYVYYSRWRNGLYKIDVLSGEQEVLIEGCGTKYYENLTVSPNGEFLVVEKVIYEPLGNYDIVENHEIWLVSLDSCYQERILGN